MNATLIIMLVLLGLLACAGFTAWAFYKKAKKQEARAEALEDSLSKAYQQLAAQERMYAERIKNQEKANDEKAKVDSTPDTSLAGHANGLFGVSNMPSTPGG